MNTSTHSGTQKHTLTSAHTRMGTGSILMLWVMWQRLSQNGLAWRHRLSFSPMLGWRAVHQVRGVVGRTCLKSPRLCAIALHSDRLHVCYRASARAASTGFRECHRHTEYATSKEYALSALIFLSNMDHEFSGPFRIHMCAEPETETEPEPETDVHTCRSRFTDTDTDTDTHIHITSHCRR